MRGPTSLSLDSRSLRASVRRGRSSSRAPLQPPMGQGMALLNGPGSRANRYNHIRVTQTHNKSTKTAEIFTASSHQPV